MQSSSSFSEGEGDSFTDSDGSSSLSSARRDEPFSFSVFDVDAVFWNHVNGLSFAKRNRVVGSALQIHLETCLRCTTEHARRMCEALLLLGFIVPHRAGPLLRLANGLLPGAGGGANGSSELFDPSNTYMTRNHLKQFRLSLNNFCRLNAFPSTSAHARPTRSVSSTASLPSHSSSSASLKKSLRASSPSGVASIVAAGASGGASGASGNVDAPPPVSSMSAESVSERLKEMMQRLQAAFISENGVDYNSMRTSPLFHEFRMCTVDLHAVHDLTTLSREALMAFFLNIYNCMVLQAEVEHGHPGGMFERRRFYSKFSYQIGSESFTMNDIEHGILRGNRVPPGALFPSFGARDPRRRLAFEQVDARLHFALNCGAKSCPPIRVYNTRNVEMGLQMAAEGFCNFNVLVDEPAQLVVLSKIFQWYRGDFLLAMGGGTGDKAADDRLVLEYICKFLPPHHALHAGKATLKVAYAPYNWSQNEDLRMADRTVVELMQQHLKLADGSQAAGLVWDSGAEAALLCDWASQSVSCSGDKLTEPFFADNTRVLVLTDRFIFYHPAQSVNAALLYEDVVKVHQKSVFKDDIVFTTATGVNYTITANSAQDMERLLDVLCESSGNGMDGLRATFSLQLLSEGPALLDLIVKVLDSSRDKECLSALRLLYETGNREQDLLRSVFARDLKRLDSSDLLFRDDSLTTTLLLVINSSAEPFLRATVFAVVDEARDHVQSDPDVAASCDLQRELAQRLLDLMLDNITRLPDVVWRAWRVAAACADEAFPGCKKKFMATAVFLRWICPAIVLPSEWGYAAAVPPPCRKVLTQVSRALQALASVSSDDKHAPWILEYVKSNTDRFERLCSLVLGPDVARLRSVGGSRRCSAEARGSSPIASFRSDSLFAEFAPSTSATIVAVPPPPDAKEAFDVVMEFMLRACLPEELPPVFRLYRFLKLVRSRGGWFAGTPLKQRKSSAPSLLEHEAFDASSPDERSPVRADTGAIRAGRFATVKKLSFQ